MVKKFEIVKKYADQGLNLPVRSTEHAAGYDFQAAEDITISSFPVLVPTGVKVAMEPDVFLMLVSRSSGPIKKGLTMPNGVGVIDADYYNNSDNEGEIFFQFMAIGEDVQIKKGDRVGQGIFMQYGVTDDDQATGTREGGFGSTGN
jgi:dUTP pyrophosphatase